MKAIIESFNARFYKKIAKQKLGRSIGFIALFIVIVSAVVSLQFTLIIKGKLPQINAFLNNNLDYIVSDFPVTEIKNGTLILPEEKYIKEWDENFALIIEPDEGNADLLLEEFPNVFLITRTKMVSKVFDAASGRTKTESYDLARFDFLRIEPSEFGFKVMMRDRTFEFSPETIDGFLKRIFLFVWPTLFVWSFFAMAFAKSIQILFFSLFSLIFNSSLKAGFSYQNLLNIGIYAIVPPTCVALLRNLLNINIPAFWFIYTAMVILYLFFGIKYCKEPAVSDSSITAA